MKSKERNCPLSDGGFLCALCLLSGILQFSSIEFLLAWVVSGLDHMLNVKDKLDFTSSVTKYEKGDFQLTFKAALRFFFDLLSSPYRCRFKKKKKLATTLFTNPKIFFCKPGTNDDNVLSCVLLGCSTLTDQVISTISVLFSFIFVFTWSRSHTISICNFA